MTDIVERQKYTLEDTIDWFMEEYEEDIMPEENDITEEKSDLPSSFEINETEEVLLKEKSKEKKTQNKNTKKKNLFRRIIDWFKEEEEEDVFETQEEEYEAYCKSRNRHRRKDI